MIPAPAAAASIGAPPLPLRADDLAITHPGAERAALAGVSFAIAERSLVALLGPSGSGKTTLLRLLAGFERPDTGSVRYGTTDLLALPEDGRRAFRRAHMGFLFQDPALFPELSPLENAALPGLLRGEPAGARLAAARARFAALGLDHLLDRRTTDLSGGEAMRVAMLRALHGDPPLLLADEPTASLDLESGGRIIAALAAHARAHGICLVATHDERLLPAFDRVLALRDGRLAEIPR